jgi:DNA repair protein RadD
VLESLLGRATVELLASLEGQPIGPSEMRQVLLDLHPPADLLKNPAARAELVDLLREDEARFLCTKLRIQASEDPWSAAKSARVTQRRLGEWLDWLGEPAPSQPSGTLELAGASPAAADYALFKHQRNALRRLKQYLNSIEPRAVLHMPTGSGKTRTAMNWIAGHLRANEPTVVVWLANSEELCSQAADEFIKAWGHLGDREVDVYRLWGGREVAPSSLHDGLLVASFASVYGRIRQEGTWAARVGDAASLVIIDEAHQAIAPTYRLVLDALVARRPSTALLGLTATPGRTWNDPDKDAELAEFFSRQKVRLEVEGFDSPVDYLIDAGYLAKPTFTPIQHDGTALSDTELTMLQESLDIPPQVLERLADDEVRSLRIIRKTEELAARHDRVILFATNVAHAERLAAVLNIRGRASRCITASTPSATRKEAIQWFKSNDRGPRILTNYGVLSAGFDAPQTSAAIIARPTTSLVLYSQMVGRATRGPLAGGNDDAEIVTLIDTNLPGFGDMAESFTNWEDVW